MVALGMRKRNASKMTETWVAEAANAESLCLGDATGVRTGKEAMS